MRADSGHDLHDAATHDPAPARPWRDPTTRRLYLFVSFLTACVLALIFRYATFMTDVDFPSEGPTVRLPEVERGPILDRNGRVLALTIQRDSVTAWVPAVATPQESARLLAAILNIGVEEVLERLSAGGFVFISRHITPAQSAQIRLAHDRGELQGIDLQPEQTRSYPEGELAAHVLGFVGVDNIGLEGIENTHNYVLAPDTITADGAGVFGNRVVLTLDVNVQHAMEQIAAAARAEHDADAVFIIVAAADSGEILGYASQPGFDPNDYAAFPSKRWRNAIATDPYEPGSVFKVFTMAALLQTGAVTTSMTFPSPGYYRRVLPNGGIIRIGDLGVYGNLEPEQILRYSSNAGTAHASDRIDADSFYRMLRAFGFGDPTGAPFLGESPGLLRTVDEWSGRTKPTIAIGQEISVTPLQIIQAATTLTNGGVLLRPQLVREIVAADGTVVKPFAREPVRTVLAPEVASEILGMMETVAEQGTGRLARLKGYRIAAKTGTAQVFDLDEGRYSDEHLIASILGVLPAEAPRFIAYVVIQHPKGGAALRGPDRRSRAARGRQLPHHLLLAAARRRAAAPPPRPHRGLGDAPSDAGRRTAESGRHAETPLAPHAGRRRPAGGAARLRLRHPPGPRARISPHPGAHGPRLAGVILTRRVCPARSSALRPPATAGRGFPGCQGSLRQHRTARQPSRSLSFVNHRVRPWGRWRPDPHRARCRKCR